MDERKKMGFQAVVILSAMTAISIWVKKVRRLSCSPARALTVWRTG
jgi:hypothetical protein